MHEDTNTMMKRLLFTICATVTALYFCVPASALELKAQLSHYSKKDGLASNAVSDIISDKYGYIWMATYNGLCRYDGYSFYNYATGLRSNIPDFHNRILKIYADTDANIWMKMYDNRVFVLDRQTDRIINAFQDVDKQKGLISRREITVTKDGFVYIITDDNNIYHMKLSSSRMAYRKFPVKGYDVTKVICDDAYAIWLATNKGIITLDKKSGKIAERYLAGENITATTVKATDIYAGTFSGKIMKLENKKHGRLIKQLDEKNISSIYVDSKGLIWFSTEKQGVSRLNTADGSIKGFTQTVTIPDIDLNGGVFSETDGILWARMTHGGFGYYDREADEMKYFHNNPDNPWNLSNTLTSYLTMPHGIIWMSTIRRGLEKLELFNNNIERHKLEPSSTGYEVNNIRSILQDRKNKKIFIGSKAGVLYIKDKGGTTTKISKNSEGKDIGRIYGLTQDRAGNIWMSTKGNGLYKLTADGKSGYTMEHFRHNAKDAWSISSDDVYCTVEDKNGNIWVGTFGGGINLLTRKNGKYRFIHKNNLIKNYPKNMYHRIRTLAPANDGSVWAGSSDGIILFRYDDKTQKVSCERLKQVKETKDECGPLESYDIIQIAKAKDGTMWIATNSGGLSRTVTRNGNGEWSFKTYSDKDGLPSNEIKSIAFDNNNQVWFSTEQTICSFDPEKQLFAIFSSLDGIGDVTCSECAATQLDNGMLFFGTLDGYYLIDKKDFAIDNNEEIKLKITDFYINNELISPRLNDLYDYYVPDSNYVKLPNRSSVFSFRFASLSHHLQHRVHYQYMLEGYDDKWQMADETRTAHFYDIPAGTYKLKVKAFLLESPDKYEIVEMTVKVPPYFWASAVALWIYFILAVGGIGTYLWLRRKRKKAIENMKVLRIGPDEIAFQHNDDYEFIKKLLDWLEGHYTEANLKIEDMMEGSTLSRTSFYNKVKSLTGLSPKELISDFRLKKAIMYLENSGITISEIAYKVGFNDPVYFTRTFKQKMKITPTKYRDEARKKAAAARQKNRTGTK